MKDFDQKSLQTLELPLVLEQLAKCAVSEAAKLRARALTPFTHEEDVRRALRETSDAKALSGLRGAPPFADLFTVTFTGRTESRVAEGALAFRSVLVAALSQPDYAKIAMQVLGPAPAAVAKINNTYRYRLTLSCRNSRLVRDLLRQLLARFARDPKMREVSAFADVNSYE